jgi:predicted enzyme related to lactoylglutathione lyase
MFNPISAFSGFTVQDIETAKAFYVDQLGLKVEDSVGGARIELPGATQAWMYPKPDHQAGNHTILNFVVTNIDDAVAQLESQGVVFEHYEGIPQDDKGILRGKQHQMGPDIAWFKDPAGNILSVLEPPDDETI